MADLENQKPDGVASQTGQPRAGTGAAQAVQDEPRIPQGGYQVVPSKRIEPETGFMTGHYKSVTIDGETVSVEASEEESPAMIVRGRLTDAKKVQKEKAEKSQTKKYAAIGIGMGLMVGLAVALLMRHQTGEADMGAVNAVEYGLMGHLTTDWKDDHLTYQVTLEPSSQAQSAGFQVDVTSSPKPLAVIVQAKDPFGAVLCSDTVLVKFDPRFDPSIATKDLRPNASRAEQALAARNEIAKGINLARLEGAELEREHGKTLFQNNMGADGQVASISAQGVLPCQKKDVDKFASWGLMSNFPIVAKPAANKSGASDQAGNDDSTTSKEDAKKNEEAAAARAKKKAGPTPQPPIFVEGDDQIVWFDAADSVAETSGGKVLLLDKGDNLATSLNGRELPVAIHYRCNITAGCTFTGVGLGLHRARLRQ